MRQKNKTLHETSFYRHDQYAGSWQTFWQLLLWFEFYCHAASGELCIHESEWAFKKNNVSSISRFWFNPQWRWAKGIKSFFCSVVPVMKRSWTVSHRLRLNPTWWSFHRNKWIMSESPIVKCLHKLRVIANQLQPENEEQFLCRHN